MTSRLELILWAAGFLGNFLLFSVLVYRKHWRQFPVFTLLAGFETVRAIVLFLISHAGVHSAYVFVYWVSEWIDVLLQVALLFELSRTLVLSGPATERSLPHHTLPKYRLGFAILVAVLCAMALPETTSSKETLDMRASLFASLLTCELYLLILTRVNRLRLEKNRQAMAIGNGIAAWSVCVLFSDLIHQIRGWQNQAVRFDEFRSFVVVLMLVYWVVCFSRSSTHMQRVRHSAEGVYVDAHTYAVKVGR